jgi:DNA-binding MarR family transcriptional regulator
MERRFGSADAAGADVDDLDLGILMGLAYAEFVGRLNQAMGEAGFDDLGPSHGYVFRALGDGPMTLTELASGLGMTTQGAAKIVEEMVGGGYVARRPDPRDGRAKQLELDERGRSALATARRIHRRLERELVHSAGPRRVATMRAVLEEFVGSGDLAPGRRLLRPL